VLHEAFVRNTLHHYARNDQSMPAITAASHTRRLVDEFDVREECQAICASRRIGMTLAQWLPGSGKC